MENIKSFVLSQCNAAIAKPCPDGKYPFVSIVGMGLSGMNVMGRESILALKAACDHALQEPLGQVEHMRV